LAINGADRQPMMVESEAGFGSEAPIVANADNSFTWALPIARPKIASPLPRVA